MGLWIGLLKHCEIEKPVEALLGQRKLVSKELELGVEGLGILVYAVIRGVVDHRGPWDNELGGTRQSEEGKGGDSFSEFMSTSSGLLPPPSLPSSSWI